MTLRLWLLIGAMWLIVAAVLAPGIGAFIRTGAREMPGFPDPGPPEWEPDDEEAQRIAEAFAESAQEGPLFDPWEPDDGVR